MNYVAAYSGAWVSGSDSRKQLGKHGGGHGVASIRQDSPRVARGPVSTI